MNTKNETEELKISARDAFIVAYAVYAASWKAYMVANADYEASNAAAARDEASNAARDAHEAWDSYMAAMAADEVPK